MRKGEVGTSRTNTTHAHDLPGRLAATYEGGVLVIDAQSLAVKANIPMEGFLRLNPAGDGQHIIVSTEDAFRFLDTGWRSGPHRRPVAPQLHDYALKSDHPGHVTYNAGTTALLSDGSGEVILLPTDRIGPTLPEYESYVAPAPHHGVALALEGPAGSLLITVGTSEARTGAALLDDGFQVIASSGGTAAWFGLATYPMYPTS